MSEQNLTFASVPTQNGIFPSLVNSFILFCLHSCCNIIISVICTCSWSVLLLCGDFNLPS